MKYNKNKKKLEQDNTNKQKRKSQTEISRNTYRHREIHMFTHRVIILKHKLETIIYTLKTCKVNNNNNKNNNTKQ